MQGKKFSSSEQRNYKQQTNLISGTFHVVDQVFNNASEAEKELRRAIFKKCRDAPPGGASQQCASFRWFWQCTKLSAALICDENKNTVTTRAVTRRLVFSQHGSSASFSCFILTKAFLFTIHRWCLKGHKETIKVSGVNKSRRQVDWGSGFSQVCWL